MKTELRKLYNTLMIVETKGDSTKTISDCLRFMEQLINSIPDETQETVTNEEEPVEE